DVVFHLGAVASVAKSVEDPLGNHAVNATGTLNVLQAARQHGVRRVVYAGSASAYGGASDPAGQDEDTPLVALSPYAAAKLAGEFYAQAFAHTYGLETVRLRFFNVFGPRQRADSPYSGRIAILAALRPAAGRRRAALAGEDRPHPGRPRLRPGGDVRRRAAPHAGLVSRGEGLKEWFASSPGGRPLVAQGGARLCERNPGNRWPTRPEP